MTSDDDLFWDNHPFEDEVVKLNAVSASTPSLASASASRSELRGRMEDEDCGFFADLDSALEEEREIIAADGFVGTSTSMVSSSTFATFSPSRNSISAQQRVPRTVTVPECGSRDDSDDDGNDSPPDDYGKHGKKVEDTKQLEVGQVFRDKYPNAVVSYKHENMPDVLLCGHICPVHNVVHADEGTGFLHFAKFVKIWSYKCKSLKPWASQPFWDQNCPLGLQSLVAAPIRLTIARTAGVKPVMLLKPKKKKATIADLQITYLDEPKSTLVKKPMFDADDTPHFPVSKKIFKILKDKGKKKASQLVKSIAEVSEYSSEEAVEGVPSDSSADSEGEGDDLVADFDCSNFYNAKNKCDSDDEEDNDSTPVGVRPAYALSSDEDCIANDGDERYEDTEDDDEETEDDDEAEALLKEIEEKAHKGRSHRDAKDKKAKKAKRSKNKKDYRKRQENSSKPIKFGSDSNSSCDTLNNVSSGVKRGSAQVATVVSVDSDSSDTLPQKRGNVIRRRVCVSSDDETVEN
jgi:hypothetical protein